MTYMPRTEDTLKFVTYLELIAVIVHREEKLPEMPIDKNNGNTTESLLSDAYRNTDMMPTIKRGEAYLKVGKDLILIGDTSDIFVTRQACYEKTINML